MRFLLLPYNLKIIPRLCCHPQTMEICNLNSNTGNITMYNKRNNVMPSTIFYYNKLESG